MPRSPKQPQKVYYSISEVSSLCGVKSHVLRYWESEFPFLNPKKNRGGRRAYTEADIWVVREIKRLLYEERFTIDGARKKITTSGGKGSNRFQTAIPFDDHKSRDILNSVRRELEDLLDILKS